MVEYYFGERLMEDDEGIPVIDADGQEIYVTPEEFDYLGRPESDMYRWSPAAFDKNRQEEGEEHGN